MLCFTVDTLCISLGEFLWYLSDLHRSSCHNSFLLNAELLLHMLMFPGAHLLSGPVK
jgi:hypothetical protein